MVKLKDLSCYILLAEFTNDWLFSAKYINVYIPIYPPAIPVQGELKQEGHEFEISLGQMPRFWH